MRIILYKKGVKRMEKETVEQKEKSEEHKEMKGSCGCGCAPPIKKTK